MIDVKLRENEATNLSESQKNTLEKLLKDEMNIFEEHLKPIPHIEHCIKTTSEPIACAPYRVSPVMKDKLKIELDDMISKGIIEEKESPWAFPVVLVPKSGGGIRLCVDYRKLNKVTITDTYPLPRMDDLLHAAKATPYMTTIDLKAGYWQIKMAESDKLKTAFTTPFGIFVFNRMPFGLKNAPATFQRLIDKFRNGLPKILILAYLDDIIICSEKFETHISDLKSTFKRIKEFGFQLNREKCHFCKPTVKYLGHILTTNGLIPDPEKTEAILNRKKPQNLKQLISFLQTCSWYRRFIPNFADVSKPLSIITKKNVKWMWTNEQQIAFDKLKQLLVSPPILQQVDVNKPFFIKADASNYALGAVLVQGEKGEEHPIEYASRLLLPAERNYSTTEREALAVVWAVNKFRGYIEGAEVTILTDHQPLKWLFGLKSPTGRLASWALQLQTFNLKFDYTPGRKNVIADMLSRPPCESEKHEMSCECNSIQIDFPRKGAEDFRKEQLADSELKKIIDSFENNDESANFYNQRGYIMNDGVLYRFCADRDSENGQLVVPEGMRSFIISKFHDDPTAGHYGAERTINRITPHYYWPGMRKEITEYIKSCISCKRYKPTNLKPAGLLQTLSSNKRFEIIAIDLFGPLPKTKEGLQWILIVEDICSRWIELFPIKEATAENCAVIILNEILLRYGIPRRIHTDNGCQFISAIMQKLTYCLNIEQSFTPVYHPEANPVERKNRDLKIQLSICVGKNHTDWNLKLPMIRFAMNSAKCQSTGYTPAYLTFARELRSPLEAHHDLKAIIEAENYIPQITPHLLRLTSTLQNAKEIEERMQDHNKIYADLKRRPQFQLNIGDKVLVNTHVLSRAKDNLSSKFVPKRDGPYIILSKKGSSCYVVASEQQPDIPIATHHVSALTPYSGSNATPIYPIKGRGRPRKRKNETQATSENKNENSDSSTIHKKQSNKPSTSKQLRTRKSQ